MKNADTDNLRVAPPTAAEADAVKTVSFVSLGCPKNLVDSEKMLGLLAEAGISPVSAGAGGSVEQDLSVAGSEQDASAEVEIDTADAVVVNTCGFLDASKRESLAVIDAAVRAKDRGDVKRVVVAGCLVQRHRAKLLEMAPGIDAMIGVHDRDKVVEAVRGSGPVVRSGTDDGGARVPYWIEPNAVRAAKARGMDVTGLTVNGRHGTGIGYRESDSARLRLTPRHYAYLRISEGCNQSCTFCTIPSIRGKMRSKPMQAVCEEARELVRDGAFELLLIGQDTTSYSDDLGGDHRGANPPLADLLRALSEAVGEEASKAWLRLMYAYPSTFPDAMVDAFAELVVQGRVLPYIDMPLQHASDRMLSMMKRHVTAREQLELCLKLRERVPGMALRTTFISGFPGETDEDHAQLMEFVEEVGFDAVGVFTYSPEPGTIANKLHADPDLAVPAEVALARKGEIMSLQQEIAFDQNRFLAEQFDPDAPRDSGVVLDILIDERIGVDDADGRHVHRGRSYGQAPGIDAVTLVRSREALSAGELVSCVIVDADGYDLIAQPRSEFTAGVSLPVLG